MERGIELKKCFAKDQLTNTPASSSPGQPRRSLDFWEQLLFLGIAASHCLTVFLCIYVIPFPGILNFIYILILLLLWSMWRNEVVMFHFLLFFWRDFIKEQGGLVIRFLLWEFRNFSLSMVPFQQVHTLLKQGDPFLLCSEPTFYTRNVMDFRVSRPGFKSSLCHLFAV